MTLAAALTFSAVIALPSAGLAAPPVAPAAMLRALSAGVPAPLPAGPDRERLTAALLSAAELPAGFTPQPDAVDDLFARIPAEIAVCGKAGGVPDGTVYREYVRGSNDEELLVETLAAPGDKTARATVAALAGVLPGCQSFTRVAGELPLELRFALSPYAAPKVGNASAAIAFVMTVPSLNLVVNGRLIAVAAHGLHVTTLLMTEREPKQADLEAAARAAVAKLRNVT